MLKIYARNITLCHLLMTQNTTSKFIEDFEGPDKIFQFRKLSYGLFCRNESMSICSINAPKFWSTGERFS